MINVLTSMFNFRVISLMHVFLVGSSELQVKSFVVNIGWIVQQKLIWYAHYDAW